MFETAHLPERDQFPFWREVLCEQIAQMTAERSGRGAFRGRMQARRFGAAALGRIDAQGHTVIRGRSQIARSGDDSFVLRLQVAGSTAFVHDDREMTMAPGDLVMWTLSAPFTAHQLGAYETLAIKIPWRMLAPLLASGDPMSPTRIDPRSTVGSLISAYVPAIARAADEFDPEPQHAMLASLCGLLSIAVGPAADARLVGAAGVAAARRHAIARHIEDNFNDPGLKPPSVAHHFGISERYLNRLLERTGRSFSATVLRCRLEASRTMLADARHNKRAVAEIAFQCGFSDLSYFNRRFRAAYGMTPRDTRHQALLRQDRTAADSSE